MNTPAQARNEFFWAWCLIGAAFTLGVVSLGVLLEVPALLAALILVWRRPPGRSLLGLLFGAGAVCFVVAALNLGGSGLDPLPWAIAGLLLTAPVGVVAFRKPR